MKAKAEVTEAPVKETAIAAENDPTGGALATAEDSSLCLSGEWGSGDLAMPYLQIVHNTGKLKKDFPVGSWVLGKAALIAEEKVEFPATCIRLEKYFRENFDVFDSNNMPRQFSTEAEAQAAGLTEHKPRTKKDGTYSAAAIVDWLVDCPEEHAMYDYGERHLARCRMFMQGTAYPVARQILTASLAPNVKGAVYKLDLGLYTIRVESETNDWPEPRLKRNGVADPEFIAWVEKNVV